jgi:hypothetical protein
MMTMSNGSLCLDGVDKAIGDIGVTKFCSNCGKSIGVGVRFCPNCGTELAENVETAAQGSFPSLQNEPKAGVLPLSNYGNSRNARRSPKAWLIVCFIAMGVVMGAFLYASPYLALRNIKQAAFEGNTDALRELVDFPSFRASLKEELGGQMSRYALTEMAKDDSGVAVLGSAFASSFVNVLVDQFVTPQVIVNMAQGKKVEGAPDSVAGFIDQFTAGRSENEPRISTGYESYGRFSVHIFPARSKEAVTLVLLRSRLATWRVIGIRLPPLNQLTNEIDKASTPISKTGSSESAVVSEANSESAAIEDHAACLAYDKPVLKFEGTLKRQTFPGPPNYESVEKGDDAETVWILSLSGLPICTLRVDGDQPAEKSVGKMQLLIDSDMYDKYRSLVGESVTVTGGLDHATTGHHHTDVMLQVTNIEPR